MPTASLAWTGADRKRTSSSVERGTHRKTKPA
jgi:hypothetical protein